MASKGGVYSQTLREITNTKLDELAKKRATFESQRERTTTLVQNEQDETKKLAILAKEMRACFSIPVWDGPPIDGGRSDNTRLAIELSHLDRFLAQARYDPSVSPRIFQQWQNTLLRHFDTQSSKYAYASLYGQLTTEWLSTKSGAVAATATEEDIEMDDYEHVSAGKKVEGRRKWEESVFQAKEIDEAALNKLLRDLFEATPNDSKHLLNATRIMRKKVGFFEKDLISGCQQLDLETLKSTIRGLIASDLLDDEKRAALRDFIGNKTILNEILDVLNMRMAAFQEWSWGTEVLLEQRRQLNGTYNIYMHEDLLQAIFLQYIGIRWSVFWKRSLASFRSSPSVWNKQQATIDPLDRKRRDYFLGAQSNYPTVNRVRWEKYRSGYFLTQLLDSFSQDTSAEEGEEEADFEESAIYQQSSQVTQAAAQGASRPERQRVKQSARRPTTQMHRAHMASRHAMRNVEAEVDDHEDDDASRDKPRNAMEAKQNLLHLLSTDILVQTWLHGELTCFRSQVDNLYPSLSHSTIKCVLSFFGVSEKWLKFFDRFLKAPLRFLDDDTTEPRQRQTGTPGAHVLSEVFGEMILFCLDFQINQETGGEPLWRMGDDFWFWSSNHATCVKAWSITERFARITGLELNKARTGAVRMSRKSKESNEIIPLDIGDGLPAGEIRWGMLYLNPKSGRFEIDQQMVDKHIDELSRQLSDKTNNLFSWIQAWNSYAATFFTSNFGKPANCFGREHVDNMLATHERIQRQIFSSSSSTTSTPDPQNKSSAGGGNGSVLTFLKQTIAQRFNVTDIPDGYFYFPTELGGLEVRNPFIGLLQIRDAVHPNPTTLLHDFAEAEREAYKAAKQRFEDWRSGKNDKHGGDLHYGIADPDFIPADKDGGNTFFSFSEYTKYRETLHYNYPNSLAATYQNLLKKPGEEGIETESQGLVHIALGRLGHRAGSLRGILADWYAMEPYWKWVAQLYGPEIVGVFGGLGIVEVGLLPMGMVGEVRGGRSRWEE